MPVFVDNDANVAALAEAHDDDGATIADTLVMLTIGTGVGGGIVIGGRIYRGATGAGAELGHQLVGADARPPARRRTPTTPPQPGLARAARRRPCARPPGRRARPDATGRMPSRPPSAGDPRALEAIRILGERVGIGVANAINVFDPDLVVIGGGVSAAGDLLLDPARETARRFVLPGVGRRTEVRLARYGPQAGVRGAALMAATELRRDRARLTATSEAL